MIWAILIALSPLAVMAFFLSAKGEPTFPADGRDLLGRDSDVQQGSEASRLAQANANASPAFKNQ